MKPIVIITWLLLGAFYWWIHDTAVLNCCTDKEGVLFEAVDTIQGKESNVPKPPVAFAFSNAKPVLSDRFNSYLDSVIQLVGENEKLVIIGLYAENENGGSGASKLGMARASAMRDIITPRLEDERIDLRAERTGPLDRSLEWYDLLRYETEEMPKKIVEIEDRTLIYFNFNSTKRIEEPEIEAYLSAVAKRVKSSGEVVFLTGHTDSYGNASYNYNLGLWRAGKIKEVLRRFGVPEEHIVLDSKGEISPIAPNNTKEGRSKNRRTELVIKEP